jgi:competence protein ComFC
MNLLDLFFPKKCVGCGKLGSYFCDECIKNIEQTELVCPKCERMSLGGVVHPVCRRRLGLEGLWSLGIYEGSLKGAIQKLKYRWVKELGAVLVEVLIEYWARYQPLLLEEIKRNGGDKWVIVSVPLHSSRQNWRGFNQSALLGKLLAQKIGLKYAEALVKTRATKPQMSLKGWDRQQNIKGAFSLDSKFLTLDSNVLLIDDVWTTGSTLKECCYILKRSGAKKIWALTVAR